MKTRISDEQRARRAAKMAEWRATNREHHREYMREYMKQYWLDHPDQRKKQLARVRKNNEKYKAEGRYKDRWAKYIKEHREEVRENRRQYYKKNRERIRAYQNEYNRKRRKANKV